MTSHVLALFQASPALRAAPSDYSGTYADFFARYVEPNLPTTERVRAFNELLDRHFAGADPAFLVRYVLDLDRRKTYRTQDGHLILPSDNSPAWWLHSYLLTDLSLENVRTADFFRQIPRHMHDIRLRTNLAKAGFHLAHIEPAKNRDTQWRGWTDAELQRRMVFSIHPWNWCLIGKPEWTRNGGRVDILSWIVSKYVDRYGAAFTEWRRRYGLSTASAAELIPPYNYADSVQPITPKPHLLANRPTPRSTPVSADIEHPSNRPFVRRDWRGRGVILRVSIPEGRFLVPHDALLDWVLFNKNVAETVSWRRDGLYSWPKTPKDMLSFMAQFELG